MVSLLVAVAGGLGAALRFVLDGLIASRSRARLPVATLAINVLGSFLLGVLAGWSPVLDADARRVLGVGLLGGFTTFSTASVELVLLVRDDRPVGAAVLAGAMVLAAVAAALVGLALGGALGPP